VCSFVWYTKKKTVPPLETSLVSVLREIGSSVVACGECTEIDMEQYEACTLKSLLASGDKQESESASDLEIESESGVAFTVDERRKLI
jgi:hypothetical protein